MMKRGLHTKIGGNQTRKRKQCHAWSSPSGDVSDDGYDIAISLRDEDE